MSGVEQTRLPVTVIGGYLGAGKTTLVNHILRHAGGRRFAVLVNEFGQLPIDADLIEADEGDLLSLSGGCICCSYGSDLMDALMTLGERLSTLDGMLIEASGVALPGAIVSALSLLPQYRADAVVVVADAASVIERGTDRYLADTIARQLQEADIVVLNKCDLLSSDELEAVSAWLAERSSAQAVQVRAERGAVPLDVLLDVPRRDETAARTPHHAHFEADGFISVEVVPEDGLDPRAVARALTESLSGVIRAKGFMRDEAGQLHTLQVVGRRFELGPAPDGSRPGLVVIGPGGVLDVPAVQALFRV